MDDFRGYGNCMPGIVVFTSARRCERGGAVWAAVCALAQSVYSVMTARARGALCKYSIHVRLASYVQLGEVG